MENVCIPCSDLSPQIALEALKRNIERVPIEALEKFVEQFNRITT